MTDNAKEAWSEVGDKFASWGRQVVERYHGSAAEEADADRAEREMKRAAKDLLDELSRGFSAIGDTLKDDRARKELTDAVSAIGDAITATVDEATHAIRSGSRSTEADNEAPPTDPDPDEHPEAP